MSTPRILVVRRDNIGDLLCTTPLIDTLRTHYPHAQIEALVNSYNAPILAGNRALDAVHIYTKGKHRTETQSTLALWYDTARLIWQLRQQRFDLIFLPGQANQHTHKFARGLRHAHTQVIGFVDPCAPPGRNPINCPVDPRPYHRQHEVLQCQALLTPLDIHESPGPLRVFPEAIQRAEINTRLTPIRGRRIALHLSAREADRRWPQEHFVTLIHHIVAQGDTPCILWSPGTQDDPRHPGDDALAHALLIEVKALPVEACPTSTLEALVATLSLCDLVVCSDGGALHCAAALGKPIVALFENRPDKTDRWYPWQVPYQMVRPTTRAIRDITLASVIAALDTLSAQITDPM